MAVVTVSLVVLAAVRPGTWGFLLLLACIGVGMGLFTSPNNASIMGAAPEQNAGMASGVLNMTRGLGTAFGLAVTGTIFTVAGGDRGHASVAMADAAHAFTVAAYVLAGIAAAAGLVAASRSGGRLASARLSAVE
jgi:MFS family permease